MYKAKHLSPMIPSIDIVKTVSFFIDLLRFEIIRDDKTYVILQKDNLTIHILRAGKEIGEMEFYLEVDDLQSIWNYIKDNLNGIKFKEPFDQNYGMREIHLVIPMTKTLLFIGQQIG
ncbi:hypothetical protein [Haliscomenobacter sp.]|uniref:hypothetical protein n=1 Tax=Haliscomenobacter sp. TaxID=2717303 RepID=UPI003364F07C